MNVATTPPSAIPTTTLHELARAALASVPDPEYPDVSIVDLGLVETIDVRRGDDGEVAAHIGLVPTFGGCPALHMIAADVRDAVREVDVFDECVVEWLLHPVWTTDRMTGGARRTLADDYTVVLRRKDGGLRCPVCGSDEVRDQSMAGPTRCRSVAWCDHCRNAVEVMRS